MGAGWVCWLAEGNGMMKLFAVVRIHDGKRIASFQSKKIAKVERDRLNKDKPNSHKISRDLDHWKENVAW